MTNVGFCLATEAGYTLSLRAGNEQVSFLGR